MRKYLDENGVRSLWTKTKEYVKNNSINGERIYYVISNLEGQYVNNSITLNFFTTIKGNNTLECLKGSINTFILASGHLEQNDIIISYAKFNKSNNMLLFNDYPYEYSIDDLTTGGEEMIYIIELLGIVNSKMLKNKTAILTENKTTNLEDKHTISPNEQDNKMISILKEKGLI